MKKLFVFDEYNSSKQNGIGTFLRNFRYCLKDTFEICMLSFNDDVISFSKERTDDVSFFRFPIYCNGSFLDNHEPGMAIIRMEIPDDYNNIFVVNHFLSNSLLEGLRKHYPKSKIVFVIHDQTWTNTLMGDEAKLYSIIKHEAENSTVQLSFELEKKMYRLADCIICMNYDTRFLLRDLYGIDDSKIAYIPNGLANEFKTGFNKYQIRKKLYLSKSEKIILYVGRITQSKGINELLIAFNSVVKKHNEARLVVLGEVFQYGELVKLCQESISKIIFTGLVSQEKLADWYRIADVGVIPSYCEQCGYSGTEMMAMRIPVVASDALGVRCMFKDGGNAIIANIGNREDKIEFSNNLANGIIKAIELDESSKMKMCDNAYNLYKAKYSLEKMREGYIKLFSSI